MDFFRSVFTEDPDPPSPGSKPESTSHSDPDSPPAGEQTGASTGFSGWGFGGLVKSLATRSESVIETYRRDLQEFGTGLKKETLTLKEVASRAVKDLPSSVEISASKAQGAFNSIAEIVAQGKESLLASDLDSDSSDHVGSGASLNAQSLGSGRYSRFEAQLRAIQCDVNTYAVAPEDVDDYRNWKLGFDLGEKGSEIEDPLGEIGGIYKRLVPNDVDHEEFWCRYYYRVQRLKLAESVRANLVKRAISKEEDEEELSWDVDDEEEDEEEEEVKNVIEDVATGVSESSLKEASSETSNQVMSSEGADQKDESNVIKEQELTEAASEVKRRESVQEPVEEVASEVRAEVNESAKDSDISPPEEDDLGWDEIEDLGSDDDKNVKHSGVVSSDRAELRKRLSAAGDEEDLNWDIEDDDDDDKPIES